jgi:TRAP-type transport system periplasmic protein
MRVAFALLFGSLVCTAAGADPITLRIATIAPDGSAWARELRSYARDVEAGSDGALHIKVYFGGIAGDEMTVLDRIKRDQLDGTIGSEVCTHLAPSMRISRIVGLFQTREESAYAMTRLRPTLDKEFLKAGYINLGEAGLGGEVLFTRAPVHRMSELRAQKLWIWDLDDTLRGQVGALGLSTQALPISDAAQAYDEGRVDGFLAIPTATLAFQWSTQARYVSDLRVTFRSGCEFISSRSWDALPFQARQALMNASAKLSHRIEELGGQQDTELLGGLLARQGVKMVPVSESFRSEFFDAARDARQRTGGELVGRALLEQVLGWLADYRAMHQVAR